MIGDVADEKANRGDEGYDHADHVTAPRISPNEIPPDRDKDGAHEIERGIDGRQVGG